MADPGFQKAMQRNPHLKHYVNNFIKKGGKMPDFVAKLPRDLDPENVNLILTVGDPVFIHLYGTHEMGEAKYYAIEPSLSNQETKKYRVIMDAILEKSAKEPVPESEKQLRDLILKLLNDSVEVGAGGSLPDSSEKVSILQKLRPQIRKVLLNQIEYTNIRYHIERNIVGSGPIEPIIRDPYLEDIHSIGVSGIFIVHKILGMMQTDLSFGTEEGLDGWLRSMSERIGRPVSDSKPIADGALPDGVPY